MPRPRGGHLKSFARIYRLVPGERDALNRPMADEWALVAIVRCSYSQDYKVSSRRDRQVSMPVLSSYTRVTIHYRPHVTRDMRVDIGTMSLLITDVQQPADKTSTILLCERRSP